MASSSVASTRSLVISRDAKALDWAGLVVILVIAIVLRFIWPDIVEFRQDEADLARLAERMVNNREIPFLGIPSSAGIPNSPVTVYAILPPYLFTNDPVIATLYVAGLNIVGAILFWLLARRYFGSVAAFIGGLAYAVSPWAVMYSRKLWAQNYHTPLILLGFLLALHGFWEKRSWAQVLALPILIIAMQIHFAAWALLPIYLFIMWTGRQNISWRAVGLSILLCGFLLIPFGIGVAQLIAQQNTRVDQGREWTTRNIIKPGGQYLWLVTGTGLDQYHARAQEEAFLREVTPAWPLWFVALPLMAIGVIGLWRRYQRRVTGLILLWAFLTPVVLVLGAIPGGAGLPFIDAAPHYNIPLIPIICLLVGLGFITLGDWLSTFLPGVAGQVIVGALALALFATQFIAILALLRFVDTTYTPTQFGFATPLRYLLHVESRLPEDHKNLLLLTAEDPVVRSDHGANVWRGLLGNQADCVREIQPEMQVLVQPARPLTVLAGPGSPDLAGWNALYRQGERTRLELRPEEGFYDIYQVAEPLAPEGLNLVEVDTYLFANDVALIGYSLQDDQVNLHWGLPAARTTNYTYTARFIGADGSTLGEQSDAFWPSLNWCGDDQLYTALELSRPAEAASLVVSMSSLRPPATIALINGESEAVIPLEAGE
jgi:hypothetical protein